MQLDALDAIDRLRRVLDEYARRTGRRAESWEQVVAAKLIRGIPRDPSGVPFELDPATGDILVSRSSELSPLPTEPSAAPELKQKPAAVPGAQGPPDRK
jgi:hypothetical protein